VKKFFQYLGIIGLALSVGIFSYADVKLSAPDDITVTVGGARSIEIFPLISVAAFSPDDVSGLSLWLKADALSLNDGDPVTTWTDSSTNSNDATQATAAKKPTFKTNIVNSQPVVRFDGTDDELDITDSDELDGGTDMIWFIVFKQSSLAMTKGIITKWNHTVDTSWAIDTGDSNSDEIKSFIAASSTSGGNVPRETSDGNFDATNFALLEVVFDGDEADDDKLIMLKNGTVLADNNTTMASISSMVSGGFKVSVGYFASLGRWISADIAEIIQYKADVSNADRASLRTYAGDKYGITIP